jgi:uncharacterized membrane protein
MLIEWVDGRERSCIPHTYRRYDVVHLPAKYLHTNNKDHKCNDFLSMTVTSIPVFATFTWQLMMIVIFILSTKEFRTD